MRITPVQPSRTPRTPQPVRLSQDLEVSVIVPALNEAKNIPALVVRIDQALRGRAYELIIVDDNSADGTPVECERLAREYPLRLIVRHRPVGGLSGAVLHGMSIAGGRNLVVMDADLQHPPRKIPELLEKLDSDEADFVLGSRYIEGGTTGEDWGFFRRWNSTIATWLARPFAGRTRDPMSGFFALRRETYARASRLTPLGYKIALELMCKCRVRRIVEVPIDFGQRVAGESKLSVRQQARYLRHLARLYAFQFPRSVMLCKSVLGAAAGWSIARFVHPAFCGAGATVSALALLYLTRQPGAANRVKIIDASRILRFDRIHTERKAA